MIAVGGRTIAYQWTLENPRIESANGISVAKRERRASKVVAGDGNISTRFTTNIIRSNHVDDSLINDKKQHKKLIAIALYERYLCR